MPRFLIAAGVRLAILATVTSLVLAVACPGTAAAAGPPASITVALSPASIPADGQSTSTVTVTVTDASGNGVAGQTITFAPTTAGVSFSTPVDNGNGTYTSTLTSSTTPGVVLIVAVDETAAVPTTPAYLTQTAPTAISLTAVANSSAPVTNQGVTLVATISAAGITPSGTVTFEGDGAPISGCTALPTPPLSSQALTVTCGTAFAAALSPVRLTAVFAPGPGSLATPSTSSVQSLPIDRDKTSTSVAFTGSKAEVNTGLHFQAVVTPSQQGPFTPGGAVEFEDHGKPIAGCKARPVGRASTASCTVSYGAPGDHVVTARYLGSTSFNGSSSSGSAPVAVQALGTVNAHMQWTFYYTPTFSEVLAMTVQGAPTGARIVIKCRGAGCPFLHRNIRTGKVIAHGMIELGPRFRRRRLAVGARISIEIVKPGWIGKYFTFTMIARHGPRISIT